MEAITTLEFDLWDGKWLKNFTGEDIKGKVIFRQNYFAVRAACFCDRYYDETDIWVESEPYIWRGDYEKSKVVAVEVFAKTEGRFQLLISIAGLKDDVAFVFNSIKETNKFHKAFQSWLEWK